MVYLIIFGFTALISFLWVNAITKMKNEYPDYKGDDFLNW